MRCYGFPYKGSKNKIAEKICSLFPVKENFYDLFCGGGAISHCLAMQHKFQKIYMNDIDKSCITLFKQAVNGEFRNEKRWISREDFFKFKDIEPYIAFCWSFGNDKNKGYMYSRVIEFWKKALHYARVYKDFTLLKEFGIDSDGSRTDIKAHEKEYTCRYTKWYLSNVLHSDYCSSELMRKIQKDKTLLEGLKRLERLKRLEGLKRLVFENKDYRDIKIKENSVIYCDIPYKRTSGYTINFDYNSFYEWCKKQTQLTFISSYEMPNDFIPIAEFKHQCRLCSTFNNCILEKVFIPKHQLKLFKDIKKNSLPEK